MFERLEKLIGINNITKIHNANVLLVGIGGVGGFALEALIRSGIENITIIDGDTIEKSNINRQILALNDNIGLSKVEEGKKRALKINPNINISCLNMYLDEKNINSLEKYDYIIDACDDIKAKLALIKWAQDNKTKIICALGTGKRLNPDVKITRLDKTINDPLAKKIRQLAKKLDLNLKIPVVYSEELPLNNDKEIASSIFTPAVAGINLAYYVIQDIIKNN